MKRSRSLVPVLGAVTASALLMSHGASAALATEVTTAISGAQADLVEAGGLIIIAAATVMGLRWVKAMFF